MRRFGHLAALLWLVLLWCALWGNFSPGTIAGGLLAAGVVGLAFSRAAPRPAHLPRPLRLLRFVGYFVVKVIESNVIVAWEVMTPGSRINQGIVAVRVQCDDDMIISTVANAISLTPGTLTIDVHRDPPTLYVHVLHLHSIERTRRDVVYLEYLAVRSLRPGNARALATLERELEAYDTAAAAGKEHA
jgi:multicomponent Na+:H+ antiporter subunit E